MKLFLPREDSEIYAREMGHHAREENESKNARETLPNAREDFSTKSDREG